MADKGDLRQIIAAADRRLVAVAKIPRYRSIGGCESTQARHVMKARDVMTTDVVTASPETSVTDIAKLLLTNGISGVPVLKGDNIVGVVNEADLVH